MVKAQARGREFESQHWILNWHFHINFGLKLCCLFEKIENKQKEAGVAHLKKYTYGP